MSAEPNIKRGKRSDQFPLLNHQPPPPTSYDNPVGYGHSPQNSTVVSLDHQPPPPTGYNNPVGHGHYPQNSTVIVQPMHGGPMVLQQPRPADHFILSIVSCFFCWPMAICALVSSLNSQKSADAGDFATAKSQGITARNIAIAAIVFSIVISVVGVAAIIVTQVFTASVASAYDPYSG